MGLQGLYLEPGIESGSNCGQGNSNIHCMISTVHMYLLECFTFVGLIPRVKLLDYMVVLFLIFLGKVHMFFSKEAIKSFPFFHKDHSNRYKTISHYSDIIHIVH